MASSNSPKDIHLPDVEENTASTSQNKMLKSEKSISVEPQSPPKLLDFSRLANLLLDDPNIKDLAKEIEKDPMFEKIIEQLQNTPHSEHNEHARAFHSNLLEITRNPEFVSEALRIRPKIMQDDTMARMLRSLADPSLKNQLRQRMAGITESSLLRISEERKAYGDEVVIRYCDDKEKVLRKLGAAMGVVEDDTEEPGMSS